MSFTYEPKIPSVLSGEIRQTIRKERPKRHIHPGDYILFHGWEGRPYRSKWSWRKKVKVASIGIVYLSERGIQVIAGELPFTVYRMNVETKRWGSEVGDYLAKYDGIDPPSGEALKETLKRLNGPDWEEYYEVIRWEPLTEEEVSN